MGELSGPQVASIVSVPSRGLCRPQRGVRTCTSLFRTPPLSPPGLQLGSEMPREASGRQTGGGSQIRKPPLSKDKGLTEPAGQHGAGHRKFKEDEFVVCASGTTGRWQESAQQVENCLHRGDIMRKIISTLGKAAWTSGSLGKTKS